MQPETSCFSEPEALRLAQLGNAAAFDFLYRLHNRRVYALCLRMVKNPTQAEDLTQETFLAVLRGIREFRGQSAFTTWLHQVTRNTVLMCFRKKKHKETSLDEIAEPDKENGRPPVELGVPDRRIESLADCIILRSAVSQLSTGLRKALVLHDLHGYRHGEVAAMLGCATGTSKSQLHKARYRVREFFKKCLRASSHDENSTDHTEREETSNPPAQPNDQPDSENKRTPAPINPPRKRERAVPSWCVPIAEEAPNSRN